ncbi:ABC transporter permease subunit/CPBP intramembrane protease [Singulisphaera rosea]
MRWSNIYVIFRSEVRDQVRDRRTLFMIFVMPLLLYPMLVIGILQFTAAFEEKPRTVLVVGSEALPESPPLLNANKDGFDPKLFDSPGEAARLKVTTEKAEGDWLKKEVREAEIREGRADAVLPVPSDLRSQLDKIESASTPIQYDSTDERSQITYLRVKEVVSRWKERIVSARLKQDNKPSAYTAPIQIVSADIATKAEIGGSVWSRLFPFLLVIMSLTGAFYPAIDLCAGEKERGTMETLLISPASRAEIVLGKFFTVLLASVMTALLNLVSMGLTGFQLAGQLSGMTGGNHERMASVIAPPSPSAAFWMLLLLIPLAAFFSALCLALAVLAKSMKEGQYYMTPLYLVSIPLIFLTMMPGIELNLFYCLVPITGVSLLLRALIMGDYGIALKYFLPVLIPTIVYGIVALQWAIDQFRREDVLFRESERFDLRFWLRHLMRDKQPIPSGGQSLFCFALMLTSAWFLTSLLVSGDPEKTITSMAISQIAFILLPPVVLAIFLTSSPRRTLRLNWPSPRYLAIAAALAFTMNPLITEMSPIVEQLFPVSQVVKDALSKMLGAVPNLGMALVTFALIPAVCEEFAFRGFILSGLQSRYDDRVSIVLSAFLFGFLHVLLSLFQQLFNGTLLGLVLGLIAVRSGSILPGIVFHLINNGMAVSTGYWVNQPWGRTFASWIYRDPTRGLYHGPVVVIGAVASVVLLGILVRDRRLKPASKSKVTDNQFETFEAVR